ncbi:GL20213 [Drosophila persimilis]|uniref:GL20213 n=1 Tax=Drosophila persimilis TaxID=7234 RepID=B4GXS5_DROPE|nr:GL20213 [Drosophila persimilis]
MVILTEQLVEAKSKVSDIRYAIRLNAWGSDLHDISILLRMPRLEVLALSLNKIRSLSSLQNCHRLKEVYLRRNEIQSFEELKHLRNAQGLRSLWMDENPCSEAAGANYRACVLRMLPQVTKLDDVEVCESELKAALQNVPYPAPKSTIRVPLVSTEFEDRRPHSLPAVQSVPSFSVPRCRTVTTAAGPGAFFVAQSRQGAHEPFGRRLAAMAEFSRSTPNEPDYDMLESGTSEAIHGSPGIAYSGMRRLRTNSNLLSSALCLIREMDITSLEDLSHAISEIVQERSRIS